MTQTLRTLIERFLIVKGKSRGMAELSLATGKSVDMIKRYRNGQSTPSQSTCRLLALACGSDEGEALQIAEESPPKAKESA